MKKILIAEDNAVNRELLRELLEGMGHSVEEASNGLEALQMIAQSVPDVLLLDLSMPILDGFATLKKIRDDVRLAPLPVLAVTAYAMQGDEEKARRAGFDGYLSKPIDTSLLKSELARLWKASESANGTLERLAKAVRTEG